MRWLAAVVLGFALVGCGSSDVTPLETNAPTTTGAAPVATGECASMPSIDPHNAPPTLDLTADPVLEAEFPAQIDGQPVTDVASGRWIEALCIIGGQGSVDSAKNEIPPGLNMSDMRVGSAQAVVGGTPATIVAFRLPGHRGDELLSAVGVLSNVVAPGAQKFAGDLVPTTAGGKSVTLWTNAADGSQSYLYATTDTLFLVDGITPSQADKIFAALP